MCGRFVQIIDVDLLEKRFGVKRPRQISVQSNFNVAPGDLAYVITNDKPSEFQAFHFAYTPSWAKKPMYWVNARAEGDFNKENDVHYAGPLGIIDKPAFRTAIRSKRCLVIANGYFEGPEVEKLNKPYHIFKKDGDVFCFAGIWDTWVNNDTGEVLDTFGIITTVANPTSLEIGHHRSPVILDRDDEKKWLDDRLPLEGVLGLLKPYQGKDFKAEPISIRVKNPKNKGRDLLIPLDKNNNPNYNFSVNPKFKSQGTGRKKRKDTEPPQQGSLF